ncbi:GNAT family N-acetyltransferase [Secundilactobacillus kimchicus]|uniref:GNAT family N-acetyltransferase n=1 Tax=Secundilactobacillus kimchicus TaxID=528209 RepID=UPI001C02DE5D|nr:GNAT family N-acetyltransferase [Secundilactobacillus kimchicus]MBT9670931.1 GNAT family N-acetyltransferase [Secundilactobacillus kimchicus]
MQNNDVTIREADRRDAAHLATLLSRLSQETTTFTIVGESGQTLAEQAQVLAQLADSSHHALFVAGVGDQLVAIASLSPTTEAPVAELGVAVLKMAWNQGLGTAMVMASLDWAALSSPYEIVTLTVQLKNKAAIHIYEKIGFTTVAHSQVTDASGRSVPAMEMQIRVK